MPADGDAGVAPSVVKRYERVTYLDGDGGKRKTMLAEVVADGGAAVVIFRPVNKAGEDRSYINGEGSVVDVQHMIASGLIVSRTPMRMNVTYGELERDTEAHNVSE